MFAKITHKTLYFLCNANSPHLFTPVRLIMFSENCGGGLVAGNEFGANYLVVNIIPTCSETPSAMRKKC